MNAGNFSSPKSQEIAVAKGNIIELLRPDKSGKLVTTCSTPVFSIVRGLVPFRLAGTYLIMTFYHITSILRLLYFL